MVAPPSISLSRDGLQEDLTKSLDVVESAIREGKSTELVYLLIGKMAAIKDILQVTEPGEEEQPYRVEVDGAQ